MLGPIFLLSAIHVVSSVLAFGDYEWLFWAPSVPVAASFLIAVVCAMLRRSYLEWALAGSLLGLAEMSVLSGRLTGLETGWLTFGCGAIVFGLLLLKERRAVRGRPIGD